MPEKDTIVYDAFEPRDPLSRPTSPPRPVGATRIPKTVAVSLDPALPVAAQFHAQEQYDIVHQDIEPLEPEAHPGFPPRSLLESQKRRAVS